MTVTFCGHSKELYEYDIERKLTYILEDLIKSGADEFLLGGYGNFDTLCARIVKTLKGKHNHIRLVFVTPYLNQGYDTSIYDESVYPPLENVPYRYAIIKRNEWMISNSQTIIAYVKYSYGGASKMLAFAKRKRKQIINICN